MLTSRLPALIAALSLAITFPGFSAEPATARFTSASVDFSMLIPPGYCPATGEVAQWMAERSAKDERNEAKVMLARCGPGIDPTTGMIVVSVARRPAPAGMTREKMLGLFADMLKRPDILEKLGQNDPREPKFGEIDDFCIYIEMDVASNAAGVPARGVGCMTMVGGQAITIIKGAFGKSDKDFAQLKREVRAVAGSIAVVTDGA